MEKGYTGNGNTERRHIRRENTWESETWKREIQGVDIYEKKERYKIYGEGTNMDSKEHEEEKYIGKKFHEEGTIWRGNIYGEGTRKRRDYIWKKIHGKRITGK